jgi:hypothetical protein
LGNGRQDVDGQLVGVRVTIERMYATRQAQAAQFAANVLPIMDIHAAGFNAIARRTLGGAFATENSPA